MRDGEIIGWIARASLRHEEKVRGPVVRSASLCDRYEGDQATRGYLCICEKLFIVCSKVFWSGAS
jgi:hypothetical protein